jgi:hypothetical protein
VLSECVNSKAKILLVSKALAKRHHRTEPDKTIAGRRTFGRHLQLRQRAIFRIGHCRWPCHAQNISTGKIKKLPKNALFSEKLLANAIVPGTPWQHPNPRQRENRVNDPWLFYKNQKRQSDNNDGTSQFRGWLGLLSLQPLFAQNILRFSQGCRYVEKGVFCDYSIIVE